MGGEHEVAPEGWTRFTTITGRTRELYETLALERTLKVSLQFLQ